MSQVMFCLNFLLFSSLYTLIVSQRDDTLIKNVILYEFDRVPYTNKTAKTVALEIQEVYGPEIISVRAVQTYWKKFRNDSFDLEDGRRSNTGIDTFTDEDLQDLLDENPWSTQDELAEKLGVAQSTISRRLHRMGKVMKANRWVPHELTEAQKLNRVTIAQSLLARYHRHNFLSDLIVADEKWIFFGSTRRQHAWVDKNQKAPKLPKPPTLTNQKSLLCSWFNQSQVVHWELLNSGETVNSDRYVQQLGRVQAAMESVTPKRRRRDLTLLHDNAKPHVSRVTRGWLQENGWEVLPHPAYSPDFNPVDFCFNR